MLFSNGSIYFFQIRVYVEAQYYYYMTHEEEVWMKQSEGPRVLECYFFSYSRWPWQLQGHFLFNFRASGNKVWNKCPSPFYFLHHCLFLHKKSSAMTAFPRSSADSPSRDEFPICLCCLTLLLLSITKTSSHNASHLYVFSWSHSRTGLSHHPDLGLFGSISHPCKNVLRLFARCVPPV